MFYCSGQGFPNSSVGKESACNAGDSRSIPGSGRFAGKGIGYLLQYSWVFLVAQPVKNHLQCRRLGFYPWAGRSPAEGKGSPLQYSGLENPMDCIVHGVIKTWTQLSDFHFQQNLSVKGQKIYISGHMSQLLNSVTAARKLSQTICKQIHIIHCKKTLFTETVGMLYLTNRP